MTRLGTTTQVKDRLKELKAAGCAVRYDREAGRAWAKDGNVKVFMALQKGTGQPWICSYFESDRVKWPETQEAK